MKVRVQKLTHVDLLQEFAGFTSGKDCKMSLATAYKNMHSIIRTQLFVVRMTDIPQFVASQLVRQTQGVTWCMRSKRTDRGGKDFSAECQSIVGNIIGALQLEDYNKFDEIEDGILELPDNYDRYAPTDLIGLLNAEALMNMAHKRLCSKASAETREVVGCIQEEVRKVDPVLAAHMVPTCIFRGGICPENKPCGFNKNETFINAYKRILAQ